MLPRARLSPAPVEGATEHDLAVFRGIPFAKAPFGALRFLAPAAPDPWERVRTASAFGPPPSQTSRTFGGDTAPAVADPSPDCLTVNVWSPDMSGGVPVLVWIHGGAFLAGSSGQPVYNASKLAREGVVVVTLNYRLGVEGFASLEGAPENRGLFDQVEALNWVQENIAAFGGDPGRVTVFGQSARAGSIAALLSMPSAQGLFHRAILQSAPSTYFSPRLACDVAQRTCAELGLTRRVADFSTKNPRPSGRGDGTLPGEDAGPRRKLGQGRPDRHAILPGRRRHEPPDCPVEGHRRRIVDVAAG
jgi:para-nitrobenzyl esterase